MPSTFSHLRNNLCWKSWAWYPSLWWFKIHPSFTWVPICWKSPRTQRGPRKRSLQRWSLGMFWTHIMVMWVVKFWMGEYKNGSTVGQKSTYPDEIILFFESRYSFQTLFFYLILYPSSKKLTNSLESYENKLENI